MVKKIVGSEPTLVVIAHYKHAACTAFLHHIAVSACRQAEPLVVEHVIPLDIENLKVYLTCRDGAFGGDSRVVGFVQKIANPLHCGLIIGIVENTLHVP